MSIRRPLTAALVLLAGFGLAPSAAAHTPAQPTVVEAYTLTTGRLLGGVAVLVALAGAVIGGLALAGPAARATGTRVRGALVALVTGLAGLVLGGIVVAAAEGGPGTGYGIVGGFAALVIGLVATVLGGLALARSRARSRAPRPRSGNDDLGLARQADQAVGTAERER